MAEARIRTRLASPAGTLMGNHHSPDRKYWERLTQLTKNWAVPPHSASNHSAYGGDE